MKKLESALECLNQAPNAIFSSITASLRECFPDSYLLETEDLGFQPQRVTPEWEYSLAQPEGLWNIFEHVWNSRQMQFYGSGTLGWFRAAIPEGEVRLLKVVTKAAACETLRWFVLADTHELAQKFFTTVCTRCSRIEGEILVFQEGRWHPDEDLYEAVHESHLDDLVLHSNLKEEIRSDIALFLEQKPLYESYRIPWKRGMLFLGPPGNGKTHMIRALASHFAIPCLYVKSFQAQYRSAQACVAAVFERAREVAPCLVILEDLDTLLTPVTRSFFLNELDGFAPNDGLIVIATCNFPEKLDPAITDRPSRFDRKYHFNLPEEVDRKRYLGQFQARFDEQLRLDEEGLDAVAQTTSGYSYAYLKELLISSAVRWVSEAQKRPIQEIAREQCETLREQMVTEWATPPPPQTSSGYHYFGSPYDDSEDD